MEERKKLPSGGGHAHTSGRETLRAAPEKIRCARELRSRVDGRCLNIEHMSRKSPGVLNATENRSQPRHPHTSSRWIPTRTAEIRGLSGPTSSIVFWC